MLNQQLLNPSNVTWGDSIATVPGNPAGPIHACTKHMQAQVIRTIGMEHAKSDLGCPRDYFLLCHVMSAFYDPDLKLATDSVGP